MFTAAASTTANTGVQPKCAPMDERVSKMRHIHTMEYYSAFTEGILTQATTLVSLEDIMRREISQSLQDKHCGSTDMRSLEWSH